MTIIINYEHLFKHIYSSLKTRVSSTKKGQHVHKMHHRYVYVNPHLNMNDMYTSEMHFLVPSCVI